MSNVVEVLVPDIGNFDSVDIIEVLVNPGDVVAKEDSLITLESDKASMDIPSSHAGKVKELKVKVGDKVAKGTLILTLEAEAESAVSTNETPVASNAKPEQGGKEQAAQPVQEVRQAASDAANKVAASQTQQGTSDMHAEV